MDTLPVSSTLGILAPTKEERTWAMITHLSAFAGHIFPFAHIIAPLVVWLIKKDESAFVNEQGKEAINAQISFTIYFAISVALCLLFVGIFMLIALYIANFILVIVAAVSANDGKRYRYPLCLRLIR